MKISIRAKVAAYFGAIVLYLVIGIIWQVGWMIGSGIVMVITGAVSVRWGYRKAGYRSS